MGLPFSTMGSNLPRLFIFNGIDTDEMRYAAQTAIWIRWLVLTGCMFESNYRVEYGSI